MKRLFDLVFALSVLVVFSPLLGLMLVLIYLEDRCSPIYSATRVGKNGQPFKMLKLRSMVPNAYLLGPSSTSNQDNRITRPGRFVRNYKLDELMQFWNVLIG